MRQEFLSTANGEPDNQMKTRCLAAVLILCGILLSCRGSEVRKPETQDRYRVLAAQKYGESAEWIPNTAKTAVLCVKRSKPTAQLPQHQVSFFIFDVASERIVFEGHIPNGSVVWKDDQSVLVEMVPGMERKDETSPPPRRAYLVDVRTGKTKDLDSVDVR
jgi:hypothetical protein